MFLIIDLFSILCLFSFVSVHTQHVHTDHKVNVDVYYESLCPDSIRFVTKQLHPALQKPEISKHVNLTFIPYGKSTTEKDSDGYLSFNCDHGPGECNGNKIHACALSKIAPAADGSRTVAFDFINCLLDKVVNKGEQTEFPVSQCAVQGNGINVADINNCANAQDGSQLLDIQGQKTAAFQKPLASVPTIVFDKKADKAESKNAEENFIKALCKHITQDQPAECKSQSGAEIQTKPIGITLVLLAVALKFF